MSEGATKKRPAQAGGPSRPTGFPLQSFYDKCPVLKADPSEQVAQPRGIEPLLGGLATRLFLYDVTAGTLHQGIALLGIGTPECL